MTAALLANASSSYYPANATTAPGPPGQPGSGPGGKAGPAKGKLRSRLRWPRGARAAISGTSIGFDGIGAPETRLAPEDISLAVGRTAAVHSASGLLRFYRVAAASGLKAKASRADTAESATFLKQIWVPDFFYAVRARAGTQS